MTTTAEAEINQLLNDYQQTPPAYRQGLLKLAHIYREQFESDDIDPTESIRRGLEDIQAGRVHPIETLWDNIKPS